MNCIARNPSAVQPLAHALAHFEKRYFLVGNIDACAGPRVASYTRFALANGKGPKASKLNPITTFQRATDLVKNCTDKTFDITVV